MLDINKNIDDPNLALQDPQGNMYDLPGWSPEIAQSMALSEGLGQLSEMHWRVIESLRSQYRASGGVGSAHQILRALERDFAAEGGRRYLYALFPRGPITQGSRLAGVPTPPYARDPSFGSYS
jgi:tRNA 2-thiouridine synthesizing protein E